jgi:hypothetical protein
MSRMEPEDNPAYPSNLLAVIIPALSCVVNKKYFPSSRCTRLGSCTKKNGPLMGKGSGKVTPTARFRKHNAMVSVESIVTPTCVRAFVRGFIRSSAMDE